MWTTYAAAILILVASAAVGAAILRLAGRDPWLGHGPVLGLALLISVAAIAIRLPGRATTSALMMGVLAIAGAVLAAPTLRGRRPEPAFVLALVAAALAAAIPFMVAGNVGVLGVSTNNDMASHLVFADALKLDPADRNFLIAPGYPVGPHAVMASVSEATGAGVADTSTALLLVISLLAVSAAWSLLSGLPGARRGVAAVLVGLPYLGAAYYAQGAFKENLQALLLLAFVAVLSDVLASRSFDRGAGALSAILAAGFLYNYSYVGFVWPVAAVIAALVLEIVLGRYRPRPLAAARASAQRLRGSPRAAVGAAGVSILAAALLLPELARTITFFQTVGVSPSATGVIGATNFGNLTGQISPLTALGIWPAEDFRGFYRDLHNAYQAGLAGAVALAGTTVAAFWWRREEMAIPAAAIAAAGIYGGVRLRDESPYLAAKALAVGSPVAMLFSLRALLARWDTDDGGDGRLAHAAIAGAFVVLAAASSFIALRAARVGPEDRRAELVSFRPLVDGRAVIMLPYDDFARWELPRSELAGPVLGLGGGELRTEKGTDPNEPSDLDALRPVRLDMADYVISTTSSNRSEPPPNLRLERRGRFYELWRRTGPTPPREVLAGEGFASGAVLDCGSPFGRRLARQTGWARLAPKPIIGRAERPRRAERSIGAGVALPPGTVKRFALQASPGTYEVSMDYVALRDGELRAAGKSAPVVANLDRLGNRWRITTVRHGGGSLRLEVRAARLPFGAQDQQVAIRELSVVRVDGGRELVPLREACGRYVDWYTLGARRPALPR